MSVSNKEWIATIQARPRISNYRKPLGFIRGLKETS
jgi:hypothetical protein